MHIPCINITPRWLAVLACAGMLAGCASYPSDSGQQEAQYVLSNDAVTLLQNPSLNDFLSKAPAGAVLSLTQSPWGDDVEIVTDAAYLAASGRECRKLQVIGVASNTARPALVCKTPNGWANQRVVAQTSQGRN